MTTTTIETTKHVHGARILERAVVLTLSRHYLGNTRKVAVDDLVEVAEGTLAESAEKQLKATKRLIDSKELAPAMRVLARAQKELRKLAIPSHRVFGERTYLIPLANIERADAALEQLKKELFAEAAELAGRYIDAVNRQRDALGPKLFRAEQYLEPHEVLASFGLDWSYVSFAAPENLETVSAVLARQAHEKYEAKLGDAWDEVRETLRGTALQVAREFVAKLGEKADGKPKVLRSSAMDALHTFVSEYRGLNLTDDADLDAVMQELKATMQGVSVEDLRESVEARADLAARVSEVVSKLEVLSAGRAFDFD